MAVYTPVGGAALERFLAGYRLGRLLRFEPIPEGIDNTNYLLETASGRYVLTPVRETGSTLGTCRSSWI